MPSIQMYLESEDTDILLNMLNNDNEIAFISPLEPKKWIAVMNIDKLGIVNVLWHIPYKNLPLVKDYPNKPSIIVDPWSGWEEVHNNINGIPYFGNCTGIIHLNIFVNRFFIDAQNNNQPVDVILISYFSWLGNYFRAIGNPALKETELWWKNLRKKIDKISQKVVLTHEENKSSGYKKTVIYAFPNAVKAIENGKKILNQPFSNIPIQTYKNKL
jgi:hypothetical protein